MDDGNGHICGIRTVLVNWTKDETGRWKMDEVAESEKVRSHVLNVHLPLADTADEKVQLI